MIPSILLSIHFSRCAQSPPSAEPISTSRLFSFPALFESPISESLIADTHAVLQILEGQERRTHASLSGRSITKQGLEARDTGPVDSGEPSNYIANSKTCADSIADSTTDLPLQMRALLLLGLSHILGKKAQLLLNDCYRIQSALGDVMSLTSNDLPKELVVASDQQITLNSGMARSSRDVDISFDQGEAVDKWINAVVDGGSGESVELCWRPACE